MFMLLSKHKRNSRAKASAGSTSRTATNASCPKQPFILSRRFGWIACTRLFSVSFSVCVNVCDCALCVCVRGVYVLWISRFFFSNFFWLAGKKLMEHKQNSESSRSLSHVIFSWWFRKLIFFFLEGNESKAITQENQRSKKHSFCVFFKSRIALWNSLSLPATSFHTKSNWCKTKKELQAE